MDHVTGTLEERVARRASEEMEGSTPTPPSLLMFKYSGWISGKGFSPREGGEALGQAPQGSGS